MIGSAQGRSWGNTVCPRGHQYGLAAYLRNAGIHVGMLPELMCFIGRMEPHNLLDVQVEPAVWWQGWDTHPNPVGA